MAMIQQPILSKNLPPPAACRQKQLLVGAIGILACIFGLICARQVFANVQPVFDGLFDVIIFCIYQFGIALFFAATAAWVVLGLRQISVADFKKKMRKCPAGRHRAGFVWFYQSSIPSRPADGQFRPPRLQH